MARLRKNVRKYKKVMNMVINQHVTDINIKRRKTNHWRSMKTIYCQLSFRILQLFGALLTRQTIDQYLIPCFRMDNRHPFHDLTIVYLHVNFGTCFQNHIQYMIMWTTAVRFCRRGTGRQLKPNHKNRTKLLLRPIILKITNKQARSHGFISMHKVKRMLIQSMIYCRV